MPAAHGSPRRSSSVTTSSSPFSMAMKRTPRDQDRQPGGDEAEHRRRGRGIRPARTVRPGLRREREPAVGRRSVPAVPGGPYQGGGPRPVPPSPAARRARGVLGRGTGRVRVPVVLLRVCGHADQSAAPAARSRLVSPEPGDRAVGARRLALRRGATPRAQPGALDVQVGQAGPASAAATRRCRAGQTAGRGHPDHEASTRTPTARPKASGLTMTPGWTKLEHREHDQRGGDDPGRVLETR